jgi:C-terminal processing protease CtpA/Prc
MTLLFKMMRNAVIKSIILALIIVSLLCVSTPAPAQQSTPTEAKQVERLVGLCKVWGLVKFTHPYLAYRNIDWDGALAQTIPKVESARSSEEYRQAIEMLLSMVKDPVTRVVAGSGQKDELPQSAMESRPQPYVEQMKDGLAVIVANDYKSMDNHAAILEEFRATFKEAAKSKGVVIDLRNLSSEGSFSIGIAFFQALPLLLADDVILPSSRFLMHHGYSSQTEPSYTYFSTLATRDGGSFRAEGTAGSKPVPLVFIINRRSIDIYGLLMALQRSGTAKVVQEGGGADDLGAQTTKLSLPEGVQVVIRRTELVNEDGPANFTADKVLPQTAGGSPGKAHQIALQMLGGAITSTTAGQRDAKANLSPSVSMADRSYREMVYPSEEYRLLALFRFWNVIEYFFPYKNLIDRKWDDTLREFIPRMQSARDAREYTLAVAEMVTRIQDSHGKVTSPILDQYFGLFRPPMMVSLIQGETVVTSIEEKVRSTNGLEVGDVVLSVDGEAIAERRARLGRYLPVSTPLRLNYLVDTQLLFGPGERPALLRIRKASGEIMEASIARTIERSGARIKLRTGPIDTVLPSGYGYVDLDRLTGADVEDAFKTIQKTPGLILDMRGYPVGGAFQFAARLAQKPAVAARFDFPEFDGSTGMFSSHNEEQSVFDAPGEKYSGPVVVLINESAQSSAEHTCLHIEAATKTTFIGTPTSGANGNVTYMVLPGGIIVRFTGLGVRHGDGRQLQRVGIQPDIEARPTIQGVRQGRDELLERAIQFLMEKTGSK